MATQWDIPNNQPTIQEIIAQVFSGGRGRVNRLAQMRAYDEAKRRAEAAGLPPPDPSDFLGYGPGQTFTAGDESQHEYMDMLAAGEEIADIERRLGRISDTHRPIPKTETPFSEYLMGKEGMSQLAGAATDPWSMAAPGYGMLKAIPGIDSVIQHWTDSGRPIEALMDALWAVPNAIYSGSLAGSRAMEQGESYLPAFGAGLKKGYLGGPRIAGEQITGDPYTGTALDIAMPDPLMFTGEKVPLMIGAAAPVIEKAARNLIKRNMAEYLAKTKPIAKGATWAAEAPETLRANVPLSGRVGERFVPEGTAAPAAISEDVVSAPKGGQAYNDWLKSQRRREIEEMRSDLERQWADEPSGDVPYTPWELGAKDADRAGLRALLPFLGYTFQKRAKALYDDLVGQVVTPQIERAAKAPAPYPKGRTPAAELTEDLAYVKAPTRVKRKYTEAQEKARSDLMMRQALEGDIGENLNWRRGAEPTTEPTKLKTSAMEYEMRQRKKYQMQPSKKQRLADTQQAEGEKWVRSNYPDHYQVMKKQQQAGKKVDWDDEAETLSTAGGSGWVRPFEQHDKIWTEEMLAPYQEQALDFLRSDPKGRELYRRYAGRIAEGAPSPNWAEKAMHDLKWMPQSLPEQIVLGAKGIARDVTGRARSAVTRRTEPLMNDHRFWAGLIGTAGVGLPLGMVATSDLGRVIWNILANRKTDEQRQAEMDQRAGYYPTKPSKQKQKKTKEPVWSGPVPQGYAEQLEKYGGVYDPDVLKEWFQRQRKPTGTRRQYEWGEKPMTRMGGDRDSLDTWNMAELPDPNIIPSPDAAKWIEAVEAIEEEKRRQAEEQARIAAERAAAHKAVRQWGIY